MTSKSWASNRRKTRKPHRLVRFCRSWRPTSNQKDVRGSKPLLPPKRTRQSFMKTLRSLCRTSAALLLQQGAINTNTTYGTSVRASVQTSPRAPQARYALCSSDGVTSEGNNMILGIRRILREHQGMAEGMAKTLPASVLWA